jgi:hypothetical protein
MRIPIPIMIKRELPPSLAGDTEKPLGEGMIPHPSSARDFDAAKYLDRRSSTLFPGRILDQY